MLTAIDVLVDRHFTKRAEDRATVRAAFRRRQLKRDACFVRQNQYWNVLGLIETGALVELNVQEGKETVHWIYSDGDFVVDLQKLTDQGVAMSTLRAVEDTTLYILGRNQLSKLRQQVTGWNEMEQQLLADCTLALKSGLVAHQTMNAEQRYDDLFRRRSDLFNRVPLKLIASHLNMSPETLSRIRKSRAVGS